MTTLDSFPTSLREWSCRHRALIDAVIDLGSLDGAASAIDAVLSVPEVIRMRLEYQVWEVEASSGGEEPEALLLKVMPKDDLRRVRCALRLDGETLASVCL